MTAGRLPREIGNLQNLFIFGVEINKIEGPIDFKIFMNMSSLENLMLWSNRFTGNLSRDVGNLTTLTYLELYETNLTGRYAQFSNSDAKKVLARNPSVLPKYAYF